MLSAENLAAIESEGRRLGALMRREPGRSVPQYEGWTLSDLAVHTAAVHGRTAQVVRDLPTERVSAPNLPDGADPIDWYDQTLEDMLAALAAADPAAECWGFGADTTVGFWERRMVIETGLHRWDAAQAFGEEDRLVYSVAKAALEEYPEMWLPRLEGLPALRIQASDPEVDLILGDGEPTATISGSASDIYLRLMSRPSSVTLPDAWAQAVDSLDPPPKR